MNRFIVLIAALLFFVSGCGTMENVTKPENKRTLILNKSLGVSYRVILSQLQKCLTPSFTGTIYPDNQTARIFITDGGGTVGDVHDLKGLDNNQTELSYYKDLCLFCSDSGADRHLEKVKQWVNDNQVECLITNTQ